MLTLHQVYSNACIQGTEPCSQRKLDVCLEGLYFSHLQPYLAKETIEHCKFFQSFVEVVMEAMLGCNRMEEMINLMQGGYYCLVCNV